MLEIIYDLLLENNFRLEWAMPVASSIVALIVIIISVVANQVVKRVLLRVVKVYIKLSKNKWDDILIEKGVFERVAHIAPAIVIHMFASAFPEYQEWIQRFAFAYMILIGILVIDPLLDTVEGIYRNYEVSKIKPIKGYLQVVKIIIYIIGGIIVTGILINRSPWLLLSGIGALTAVMLLVFQNSILGLVAGVQLTSNDMVRLGDWIEMPKYNADGDVVDITLHTIKVQNWDRTITTIPSYALISDSFKNWRGMQESGGRRIKRSVYIDMNSIKFCTDEMLERFEKFHYLSSYIPHQIKEIEVYNKENNVESNELVNGRRMTNIGTFRAYIQEYIKNHTRIHKGMIMMVRQLSPSEHGLPIEIYAFTNDTAWVNYEAIQSDIFDHILAVVPQFDLKVYQSPSGQDFKEGLGAVR